MKILLLLRVIALGFLLIVAVRPVVVRPDPGLPSAWAVLLDTSRSMAVKDPVPRLAEAKKMAASVLDRFPRFKLFSFDKDLGELDSDKIDKTKAEGKGTNFAGALKKIFEGDDYRGALILTDGRHVGQGDSVSQAASSGRPLLLIGFGNKDLFKDVSIRSIQSPPFAFKNVQTNISAVVSAVGFAGQKINVRLKQGNRILGLQTVTMSGNDVEANVTFSWTPRSLGTKVLTVEASQYSGEFTTVNNRKQITLDIGRDRFRVLYICGKPGPEYGFLRHQFKADPAVELVTFVILRNANNVVNVPDAELSLIPFPTQDVLINQMASFDLVVFEEFSYQQFGLRPQVLYAIRKKVEDGGSFLMIAGPQVLGVGTAYAQPGIQEMIPVQFGGNDVKLIEGGYQFKPQSYNHPILRLDANPSRNRDLWNRLPALEEITLVPGVKSGATILGTIKYAGRNYPVLTAWNYKKGRVAVMTARSTWRFSMLGEKKGGASFAYQQFWKNMVLWLTHSDQFKPVRVAVEKKKARSGEDQTIRVWAYDEYFKPISDVDVRLQVKNPDGESAEVKVFRETKGVFVGSYRGNDLGKHQVQAWVFKNGKKFGQDRTRFQVVEGFFEQEDLRPDFDHLKELAHATGGRFVVADGFSLDAFNEFNEQMDEKVGKKILLWNSPWFLAAILFLLCVEWFIRKRRGLP